MLSIPNPLIYIFQQNKFKTLKKRILEESLFQSEVSLFLKKRKSVFVLAFDLVLTTL
jgi:hypothetical protein